ncbi:unknown [Clostridium sp. CAG:451]|jgi:hypothetical protein|nr:unknown [Clostridium sp. CAG:451]
MSKTLKIYYFDENYINFLRKYDNRVAYNKNHLPENVKNRYCDFYPLEQKSKEYIENELEGK